MTLRDYALYCGGLAFGAALVSHGVWTAGNTYVFAATLFGLEVVATVVRWCWDRGGYGPRLRAWWTMRQHLRACERGLRELNRESRP